MKNVLETPRMLLRPFEANDAAIVFPWMTDTEIMRYMPTGQDYTLEQVQARVNRYMNHQEQRGYSRWMIFDRATGEAIGDAGILYLPATGENELGYRLVKPWWGKGLATEVAEAWMQYAFNELGMTELIAFSHPDNVASVRVMEKCGFEFLRNETIAGMGVVVYSKHKDLQP
jgi:[ribosomal protein S5]-alanine N-acetyltransferase